MIPVTSFAGKNVAVFGLGGSGLVSASALLAGGAEVDRLGRQRRQQAPRRQAPASPPPTCASPTGRSLRRAGARARRAAHPSGAALDRRACARRRRRGHRRHRAVLPRAAPARAERAVRRHHRHQRQVDHHRADRASGRQRRLRRRSSAAISAPPSCRWSRPARGRVHVIEVSSYQVDLAPSLDPSVGILINVSEDHLDRHGTLAQYAAVKERLVAGVQDDGTAIVGVDDNWCQAAADRIEQRRQARRARVGAPAARRRHLCRGRADHAGRQRQRRPRSRCSAASARCAACTMRRTPPARRGAALALGLVGRRRSRRACARSRASRIAWRRSAARARVLFVNDSKATNADSAAQALACFERHLLDRRRQAEDRRALHARPGSSRASARPI